MHWLREDRLPQGSCMPLWDAAGSRRPQMLPKVRECTRVVCHDMPALLARVRRIRAAAAAPAHPILDLAIRGFLTTSTPHSRSAAQTIQTTATAAAMAAVGSGMVANRLAS